jgi:hypothetical protein
LTKNHNAPIQLMIDGTKNVQTNTEENCMENRLMTKA